MKLPAKNKIKISVLLLALLPIFLFFNISVAKADVFSEMTSGVATFVHFVVQAFSELKNKQTVSTGQAISSNLGIFSIFSIPGFLMPNFNNLNIASGTSYDFSVNFSSNNNSSVFTTNTTTAINTPVAMTTETQTTILPGGLSGSTAPNGVSLNDSQIMYWTNIERNDNGGLSALSENNILDKIAAIRVEDMFAKQYFDHYSPSGDNVSKEADANGYSYITIGENIAEGNFGSSRDLVTAWMNSPGHRANILNTSYTEIGVAAEQGMYQGNEVWISSEVFGKPLSNCPGPDVSIKQQISADQAKATNLNTELASAKAKLTEDSSDSSAYNAEATIYNNLANQYNNLVAEMKTLASQYNQQVAAFNACIK